MFQLEKAFTFSMRAVLLVKMNHLCWTVSIKDGSKLEFEKQTRELQRILKPGGNQRGLAYSFPDAKVLFFNKGL